MAGDRLMKTIVIIPKPPRGGGKGLQPTLKNVWESQRASAGVEHVAERIAHQVQREHDDEDGESG